MLDLNLQSDTMAVLQRDTSAFKAYDIRGVVGENIDADFIESLTHAACDILGIRKAAIGFDARDTSPRLALTALKRATNSGCNVVNLGLCGTEEVCHAVGSMELDLGFMVTASRNPIDHNGLKLVGPGARPLMEIEFAAIQKRVASAPSDGGPESPAGNLIRQLVQPEADPHTAYVSLS